jgi:hypothetical protein
MRLCRRAVSDVCPYCDSAYWRIDIDEVVVSNSARMRRGLRFVLLDAETELNRTWSGPTDDRGVEIAFWIDSIPVGIRIDYKCQSPNLEILVVVSR